MKAYRYFFAAIVLWIGEFSVAESPRPAGTTQSTIEALRNDIETLKRLYYDKPITEDSPEYEMFERIGRAARMSETLVEELIDLTAIHEVPPPTEEPIGPLRLSPAGRQLTALEDVARPMIDARLEGGSLTDGQRKVLVAVIHIWKVRADAQRRQEEYLIGKAAEKALRTGGEAGSKSAPLTVSAVEDPDEPNPNAKRVWTMLFAAGVLGVAWIGVRWRCCIRKRTGTTAEA